MIPSLVALLIAGILSFLVTPPVRRLAEQLQVIDKPDRNRKRHRRLIPLWGGLAIFLSLFIAIWIALQVTSGGEVMLTYREGFFGSRMPFLFSAGALLLTIGLIDDRFPLPPKVKLLAQIVAATLVVMVGFHFIEIVIPFLDTRAIVWPGVGVAFSILWMVFFTNAFNFIDGLDGLASSQAVISGLALAGGALILMTKTGDMMVRHHYLLAAVIGAAVAGSASGFFKFNHFPARIFLGDAGSNLLGFSLAFSALLILIRSASAWTPLFVLLVLGWPIFDIVQVVIRRWQRGEPISKADNRHLHHLLMERGFTNSSAVAFINMIVIIFCVIGLVIVWL
ncbi:undecaprenyl/decaprenyl-phosphate alpha-N-acetylglucosaminyl 1-phosphate transferase [bacterium]|nr:undecaprenyl/decaprenyl-phosphate alpha-N-acetylglucosaminyl 1-phosphate transferase [bacterium]